MAGMEPAEVINLLQRFRGRDLTSTLARIEGAAHGLAAADCSRFLLDAGAAKDVLVAAAEMKRLAGQINVVVHALGILLCLPHVLKEGEHVEYLSLGAGNTGREFDLETNYRVAEFKFINWHGGPESIRQNQIFKDFFLLAESETTKHKVLYVIGKHYPLKFFNGGRALASVLSKDEKVRALFNARFGNRFTKVLDYYQAYHDRVTIEDVSVWLPELTTIEDEQA